MKQNNLFEKQVRLALSNFDKAGWLGEHSPLATPYFLGHLLDNEPESIRNDYRGECLKQLLLDGAAGLWGGPLPENRESLVAQAFEARDRDGSKSGKFGFLLLELYFFRKYFPSNLHPQQKVEPIIAYTASSRTRFFGYLNHFIPLLASRVKEIAQPGFRLEMPQLPAGIDLIGRSNDYAFCVDALRNNRAVNLNGAGGVGKTSLGIELATAWGGASFWYTIRPGLNDNLHSLLFSLGHFLNLEGCSALWLQLLADTSKAIDLNLVMGCLREDLAGLDEKRPLLCFDEIDLLGNIDGRTGEQQKVVEILDYIHQLAPTIFIGQHAIIDAPEQLTLFGLHTEEIGQLLAGKVPSLPSNQVNSIFSWTKGNPRFVELVAALINCGAEWNEIEKMMGETLAGRPIIERLWKRLTASEKQLLGYLSVFRSEIPIDPFLQFKSELDHLAQIGIIGFHQKNNMVLTGMFQSWINRLLLPEQREEFHDNAAILHAELGEYSESAWHFAENQNFEKAIQVWHAYRDQEINRGHAEIARQIFQNISLNKLDQASKEKLKVIRAELNLMLGLADQIVGETKIDWTESYEKAEYLRMLAKAHFMLGNHDLADKLYVSGIQTLTKQSNKLNEIRFARLAVKLRDVELETAENEILNAEYQVYLMKALLFDHKGRLDDAAYALQSALELAEQLGEGDAIAKIKRELAINFGRRGDMVHAEYYSKEAMTWYKKKGDRLSLEGTRANLAGMYLQAGEFEKVIANSEKPLKFFKNIKHESWIASICHNMSEAHLELGNIDEAEQLAYQVVQTEDTYNQPYAMYTIGLVNERKGEYELAHKILSQGLEIAEQTGDRFISAYLHRVFGSVLIRLGQIEKANEHLSESHQIFNEMSLHDEASETEVILKEIQPINA